MISVVISACLIAQPMKCEDFSLQFAEEIENVTPFACMRYAQPELVKWNEHHPHWKIRKWKCKSAGKKFIDI